MSDPNPVCITCHKEMRIEKTGILVLRQRQIIDNNSKYTEPYSVRAADLYKCPGCLVTQLKGYSQRAIHYSEKEFAESYALWGKQEPAERIWYT